VLAMVFPLVAAAAAGWTLLCQPVRTPGLRSVLRWGGGSLLLLLAGSIQLNCLALGTFQTQYHGLFGLQWGAQAIYRDALPRQARLHPKGRLIVTHVWCNNSDVFVPYFGWSRNANEPNRQVELISYISLVNEEHYIPGPDDVVVLTDVEYAELQLDPAVASHRVLERLRGPDGSIHFYVVSLTLKSDWRQIRQAAKAALAKPVASEEEDICGGPAHVLLGGPDGSNARQLLYPAPGVVRCHPDVPLNLRIDFGAPRDLDEVVFEHWENGALTVSARAFGPAGELSSYQNAADISSGAPQREVWKPAARGVTRVEIVLSPPSLDVLHIRHILLQGRLSEPAR